MALRPAPPRRPPHTKRWFRALAVIASGPGHPPRSTVTTRKTRRLICYVCLLMSILLINSIKRLLPPYHIKFTIRPIGAQDTPEKTTIVLDSPHDRHISHARDGAGSKVSPHRLTSLLPSHEVRQTGSSTIYVSMHYISRTWSWAKATIWLPSPPMGLTIHIGAQVHGEPRGIC